MPLRPAELDEIATTLAAARATATKCDPPTTRYPGLSLADGYAISRIQLERRVGIGGERHAGHKIGLTTAVHRARYGVSEPSRGYLTHEMRLAEVLSARTVLTPQVEGEVVFVLGRDLDASEISVDTFAAAVDHVCLGIEVTDRRIGAPPFTIQDHVADNSFACAYVLGNERHNVRKLDLAAMRVTGTKNGAEACSGTGAALMGGPLHTTTWLANHLAKAGEPLRAGQLIFSGSFGPPLPISAGDRIQFSSPGFGSVELACIE